MADFEKKILKHLNSSDYTPVKRRKLTRHLAISSKQLSEFQEALRKLIYAGKVSKDKHGLISAGDGKKTAKKAKPESAEPVKRSTSLIVGTIRKTARGFGFLIPHTEPGEEPPGDVYISQDDMADAHSGDEVFVQLLKRRRNGGQRCGRVHDIIERASNSFVGTYFERGGQGFVLVDGKTFTSPISVGDPGAKGAQQDDKVVIEMIRFPNNRQSGEAALTEVLGPRSAPGMDTLSIIREFGLPDEFPEAVLEEARQQALDFEEPDLSDRDDLTSETIVTIDPADARDFDDAISLTRSEDGHWHFGIHIAEVSYFVKPGSALDEEAQKRGTSVYLPDRVIPMLPEVISNGLASLQQKHLRFAKTAQIEFTADGASIHTKFQNTAIKVSHRFCYEDVLPVVENPDDFKGKISANVRELVCRMHEFAMILRKRRFESGALELNLAEVKIDFDKQGQVCGAHEVSHDESHQMIEEFMLAANIAVATELFDQEIPFLRRTHPSPDVLKLKNFSQFSEALGFPIEDYQSRPALQALINRVQNSPREHAINYALLRSMKQAEYTGLDIGHFALAINHYCHFTSPIRRYPDLTIHRTIDAIIHGKKKNPGLDPNEVTKLGRHCSTTERRAAAAERELKKFKLLSYVAEKVGDEFDAVITGVERFGIFCAGIEVPVEGLVHVSQLMEYDNFYHEPETFQFIGKSGGLSFQLGDRVRVKVAHVDLNRRSLDYTLVLQDETKRTRPKSSRAASGGKRKPKKKSPKSTRDKNRAEAKLAKKKNARSKGRAKKNSTTSTTKKTTKKNTKKNTKPRRR